MIEASCHCGAVRLEIPTPPSTVTDCNCSLCRRYGVRWAYYPSEQVRITAPQQGTQRYVWGDGVIGFHRCATGGCITHWAAVAPPSSKMGVNARLMAPEVLASVRVRHLDGADSWTVRDA